MNKSPCFPFFPSDFFGDVKVRIMSGEEQAFYMLLLANIWEYDTQFSIPNDSKLISTLLKISEEKYLEISEKILACFDKKNGRLISKRLKREKDKQDNYRKQQSLKGLKSAQKRSTTVQQRFNNGSTEVPTGSQPEGNCSSSKPKPSSKPKKNNKADFVLPDWIPIETWKSYLELRDKKKAAKTDYALNLIIKELQKIKEKHGQNAVDVLNKSIKSGWIDVYPLKLNGDNGNNNIPPRESSFEECPSCGAELRKGYEYVVIGGKKCCEKCPEAKEQAKKEFNKLNGIVNKIKPMPAAAH